jgi:hypothetical protein
MRFVIIHKTNARWEAGCMPDRDLVADVGQLIGELTAAGVVPGSARDDRRGHPPHVAPGPFVGANELPAGFDIIRSATLDDAVRFACELGQALSDVELDVRPVTEAWDIGLAPPPEDARSQRFMVLRKATAETESGAPVPAQKRAAVAKVRAGKAGDLLVTETMRPSSRGRRCKNSRAGITFTDGPFTESKELIAGFVIVEVASLDEASRWTARYIKTVQAGETDVYELEDA